MRALKTKAQLPLRLAKASEKAPPRIPHDLLKRQPAPIRELAVAYLKREEPRKAYSGDEALRF